MDIKDLIMKADIGTTEDKLIVAKYYYAGEGDKLMRDEKLALDWFLAAAKDGSVEAMCYLGNGFLPSTFSREKSIYWLKKAVKLGSDEAINLLGELYYAGGQGKVEDYRRAHYWFMRASKAGNSTANYYLHEMYLRGHYVKANPQKAIEWLRKALDQDNALAFLHVKTSEELAYLYEEYYDRDPLTLN